MNQNELKAIGMNLVAQQLKRAGWSQVNADKEIAGPIDVVASHNGKILIISVTPAVMPERPENLKEEEKQQVWALARQNNAEPYQVKVSLDQNEGKINDISWIKLWN